MSKSEKIGHPTDSRESLPQQSAEVYLVRHAESEGNIKGNEHKIAPSLTSNGVQQATELGRFFKENNIRFSRAFTSHSERTIHTAQLILEENNSPIKIFQDHNLRERHPGMFRDANQSIMFQTINDDLASRPPEIRWDHIPDLEGIDRDNFETYRSAAIRLQNTFENLVVSYPGEKILIVTHSLAMAAHLAYLRQHGLIPTDPEKTIFDNNHVRNTGYYVLEGIPSEESIEFSVLAADFAYQSDPKLD